MVTWSNPFPSPRVPISFQGGSPGPRDFIVLAPALPSFNCKPVLSPLRPQFAHLYSDSLASVIQVHRLEFLLLLLRGRVSAVSHAGPLPAGVSHWGGWQCLKRRRKS